MSPNDEIERRVKTAEVLIQLQTEVKHCRKEIAESTKLTGKALRVLYGDGDNGLITRMKMVEGETSDNTEAIGSHIGNHEETRKWWRRNIARTGIVITGTGIVTAILYLIQNWRSF